MRNTIRRNKYTRNFHEGEGLVEKEGRTEETPGAGWLPRASSGAQEEIAIEYTRRSWTSLTNTNDWAADSFPPAFVVAVGRRSEGCGQG